VCLTAQPPSQLRSHQRIELTTIQILGLMPLGTAMDSESARMRALGSWDGAKIGTDMITAFTRQAVHGSNFTPSDAYSKSVVLNGYGENASPEEIAFWTKEMKRIYRGDEGRKSLIMCAVNLREHDSLIGRLGFVKCPVLWMHGSKDIVFSVANAKDEIRMFTGSESAELVVVEGGHHFLSATHPEEVNRAMIGFVNKYRR
jgi:pimeloyl-ACP methyl ester carboxylesterase